MSYVCPACGQSFTRAIVLEVHRKYRTQIEGKHH